MSRLTKPILKASVYDAILGDGTGVPQMIYTRPADEAFRRVLTEQTQPGGMLSRKPGESGTVSSQTLAGDSKTRVVSGAPTYDPKFVSINPYLNPYLDYLIDKMSEGVASAHQIWQERQRVRGRTHHDSNDIKEVDTHLPFQTENVLEDQSDYATRGDVIDTGQRDFEPRVADPRSRVYVMAAEKAQAVKTSSSQLGGVDLGGNAVYDPAASSDKKAQAVKISKRLLGNGRNAPIVGRIHSDQGKYASPQKASPPGGQLLAGLFIYETWRKIVTILQVKATVLFKGMQLSDAGRAVVGQIQKWMSAEPKRNPQ